MYGVLGKALVPLISGSTYRRWVHLILGGAVLVPYTLATAVLASLLFPEAAEGRAPAVLLLGALAALPLVVVTAFIPVVRELEGTAATVLLGGRITEHAIGAARSWATRWRTAGWFCAHLVLGFLVCLLTMFVLPEAFLLITAPLTGGGVSPSVVRLSAWYEWLAGWAPLLGVALVAALVYLVAGAGALLARLAPVLLGPSPAERLARLERQAEQLAERNRLARELHDSVGHALTATTLQAGAAQRVLDTDPEFARRALAAIEEAGRTAMDDLDHVLGLLRDGVSDRAPQPTLTDLDRLLTKTRGAGVDVHAELNGGMDTVPAAVSREAYRIVQEGLTNALRHAGRVPVTLRLAVQAGQLELEMTNPLAARSDAVHSGRKNGGRGLYGMRERVTILGGRMTAAADGQQWRVAVQLPLRSAP